MGLAVAESIAREPDRFLLAAKFSRSLKTNYLTDQSAIKEFCAKSDVVIDFSDRSGMPALLEAAIETGVKLVIGTTGLDHTHRLLLEKAAKEILVVYATNTSIGANIVIEMAGYLAKILKHYDAEIIDIHHKQKKDSPSGTAISIGTSITNAREHDFEEKAIFGRGKQYDGIRKDGEIGFSSIRAGGIYGEHEVIFAGTNEVINLGIKSLSRAAFADGALLAASWLCNSQQKPGRIYSMKDVLSLHSFYKVS